MKRTNRIIGIVLSLTLILGTSNAVFAATEESASGSDAKVTPAATTVDKTTGSAVTTKTNTTTEQKTSGAGVTTTPAATSIKKTTGSSITTTPGATQIKTTTGTAIATTSTAVTTTGSGLTTTGSAVTTTAEAITSSGVVNLSPTDQVNKPAASKVIAYVKPDFKIRLNDKLQIFKDSSNQVVFPLVYRGSTYLPVRAVSALMDEDIEWDNYSKTVFIGKTLSNPSKSKAKKNAEDQNYALSIKDKDAVASLIEPYKTTVTVRPDINIMYDFELKGFRDSNDQIVYPILYNGSTYLPLRSISGLMNEPIVWDNATKTIFIGDGEDEPEEKEEPKISKATLALQEKYDSAVELYDQATDKILSIQEKTSTEELSLIAAAVTEDVALSQKQTIQIKNMNTSSFTEKEILAKNALYSFAEASEYYILVLENISYLAAAEADYSMLAETFVDFALQSREKMDAARKAIEKLYEVEDEDED